MEYFERKSRVRELQADLFPVQPIPGSLLTQQFIQAQHFGFRKDLDSVLTLPITANILKLKESEGFGAEIVIQEPRWPVECRIIQERIQHIDYHPATPEPYYVSTGKEPRPKPVSEQYGTVIFNYSPTSVTNYFSRSCAGGIAAMLTSPDSSLIYPVEDQLVQGSDLHFESRFESGNLGKVLKITDTYYQLHLRKDLYTQRHMQWFYFRISNTRSQVIYRISIVNLSKEDSLYNEGLKPLLYSTKDANLHAVGWRRCGDNISYYKNDSSDEEKEKHTLTFNITFPHDSDTVYLAHCYPYTYTDLQEYLASISRDPVKSKFTKLRLLCRTLAGNNVHYLTITAPNGGFEESRKKKGIVITSRVHPGETPSSWMMKGIIDFLTGDSEQAKELRERFIFKLVPMLNPDGVIVGNNRCSLSGKDLNRQYRTVMRESYPSVWHTKLMIRRLMEECGITMYCDLHAHSRKHNIFIYGCENKRTNCYSKLTEQIFPLMLHKNAADKFSFENCKFHIEKGKEGTSRVVVWLMGVQNSYTMEASMAGSKLGSRSGTHFSIQDYENIGKAFCETLLDFSDDDPFKERLRNKILQRLMKEGSSADEPTNINLTDYSSDEDNSSSSLDDAKQKSEDFSEGIDCESQLLWAPPPSPRFLLPKPMASGDKKNSGLRKKTHQMRRKLLNRRTVMDLPATDPGSDVYCDLTDSADENQQAELVQVKNERKTRKTLPILKSQLLTVEKNSVGSYCNRIHQHHQHSRLIKRLLPTSRSSDPSLSVLKQQFWTGRSAFHLQDDKTFIPNYNLPEKSSAFNVNNVSHLALIYQHNSDALLKSCSKKLVALDKAAKLQKSSQKATRSKKLFHEFERKVPDDPKPEKKLQSIQNESLKLMGISKMAKPQKLKKTDSRKVFRKSGLIPTSRSANQKSKSKSREMINDCTSQSSDEVSVVRRKTKKKNTRTKPKK